MLMSFFYIYLTKSPVMGEIINYSNITFEEALKIISEKMNGRGTRVELINAIGAEMYNKLCVLGFITQGATIDVNNNFERIRVWKLTKISNLFEEMRRKPTEEEKRMGTILAHIGI